VRSVAVYMEDKAYKNVTDMAIERGGVERFLSKRWLPNLNRRIIWR
jgi:nuclear transport factor 2 (NTF2) superfamily protein